MKMKFMYKIKERIYFANFDDGIQACQQCDFWLEFGT